MDIPCPVFPEFQESQCLVLLENHCVRHAIHTRNHRGGSAWILIFLPTPELAQKIIMAGAFAPATITILISRGISD